MTIEQEKVFNEMKDSEWFKTRPEIIQKALEEYPPVVLYKFKNSGKQCVIISAAEPESGLYEDVTFTVQKTGVGGAMAEMGLGKLDRNQVFGVKLTDLELWES